VLSTLEASEVSVPFAGEEVPTLNGQAESTADSLEREPDLEPADEVTENGPTGELFDQFCLFLQLCLRSTIYWPPYWYWLIYWPIY